LNNKADWWKKMANPFDPVAHDDTLATVEDTPIIFTKAQLLGNDNHAPLGGGSLSISASPASRAARQCLILTAR
jgi:hypothetical protein